MTFLQDRWLLLLIVPIRAALFCTAASGIIVVAALIIRQGWGTNDVLPFLIWTALFTIGVAGIAFVCVVPFAFLPRVVSYPIAFVLGAIGGVLWSGVVLLLLGPWFMTFTLPVTPTWMAGGTSGLVAIAGLASRDKKGNLIIELLYLIFVSVLVSSFVASPPNLQKEREVELIRAKWQPSSDPLSFTGLTEEFRRDEVDFLKTLDLTGRIRIFASSLEGAEVGRKRQRVRVVIVMYRPIDEPVDLFIPAEGSLMYVQTEQGWKTYPANVSTLPQALHLIVSEDDPEKTEYWMEVPGGVSSGVVFTEAMIVK